MKFNLVNSNIEKNYGEEILKRRGVEDVSLFLNPDDSCLQSPYDLKNVMLGAKLIKERARDGNNILLLVDCDVDGFTSSTIIYQYLKRLSPNLNITFLLHEGKQHGLEDQIEEILINEKVYDLMIIPDAGSNDYEYIERLSKINLPVLILDHHALEKESPISANCVIINNQISPNYKNKDLSGAGIAFQFCRVLDECFSVKYANDYMDLAALGIVADMMSMLKLENQYIIKNGLHYPTQNYFFNTLMEKQAYSITGATFGDKDLLNRKLNPISVAFYIVPMINALIRVGSMEEKERLFMAFLDGKQKVPSGKRGCKGEEEEVAVECARECTNAKNKQNKIKERAVENLEAKIYKNGLLDNKILFVRLEDDDDFPSVLNGLVAMNLSAKYKKPTIVARLNNEGYIRGSIRGLNKSELESFKDFLIDSSFFEYVQGHDNAAGCSIPNNKLKEFHDYANETLKDVDFGENVYDVEIVRKGSDSDIAKIIYDLNKYENCWGQQNDEPLIAITDLFLTPAEIEVIGKNQDTLKINKNGIIYIKFFAKEVINKLLNYDDMKVQIIGKTNINVWQGVKSPQIIIEDLEVEDASLAF